MYILMAWLCIATNTTCPYYESPNHLIWTQKLDSKAECEAVFRDMDAATPDPLGFKSNHTCTPVSEGI